MLIRHWFPTKIGTPLRYAFVISHSLRPSSFVPDWSLPRRQAGRDGIYPVFSGTPFRISHSSRSTLHAPRFMLYALYSLLILLALPALAQTAPVTVTWTTQSHFENNGADIVPDPGFSSYTSPTVRTNLYTALTPGMVSLWPQPNWLNKNPAISPTARYQHALAHDPASGKVILFGGNDGGYRNDTWYYDRDQNNWIQIYGSTTPPARSRHAMAPNPGGGIVLFGGYNGTNFNDTWVWNGTDWIQQNVSLTPTARCDHAMAYDPVRNMVVLFGGDAAGAPYLNDVYHWNGSDWQLIRADGAGGTTPSQRRRHTMAWDGQAVILFGGNDGVYKDDTWSWNGTDWTSRGTGPTARESSAMAYDAHRDRVILFGGSSGSALGNTYEWDRTSWSGIAAGAPPANRYWHAMVYDPSQSQIMLFGGWTTLRNQETYTYRNPSSYQVAGTISNLKLDSRCIADWQTIAPNIAITCPGN